MKVFLVAAAMFVMKLVLDMRNDALLRENIYTLPLSRMPQNADALAREMLDEAAKDKSLTASQLGKIEKDIYRMLSQGAVAQRNFEMEKTRQKISYIGLFLSWFMKQKGLTYEQIQVKYEKEFSEDERRGHQMIINSAARSNQNLLGKFYLTLQKLFGGKVQKQAKL